MVNSDDQYNEFDEYQCTSMLNVNEDSSEIINIGKRKTNSSVCNTKNASDTIVNEDVEQNIVLEKLPDLNNVKSEQKRSKVNNIGLQKVNSTTKTTTRKTEGVIKQNSTSGNTKINQRII